MLGLLTVRECIWLLLLAAVVVGWRLDSQLMRLEVSDQRDDAKLFRADNLRLEQYCQKHVARILQLESEAQDRRLAAQNAEAAEQSVAARQQEAIRK